MIQNGYKTKFITASELVEELLIANEEHKLGAFEKKWLKFDVIIVDELGYVPFSKTGAELLFQFFSGRYERAVDVKSNFTLFARFLFTLLLKKYFSCFSSDDFPHPLHHV